MLTQHDADQCIEAASAELKSLSYEELEKFVELEGRGDAALDRELEVSGEIVYVNTTIGKLRRFRKRICVEMILSAEGGHEWERVPCVYFERFESGRLWVAPRSRWAETLFRALPYVFFVVGAFVFAVWIVRLILRFVWSTED